MFELKKFNYNGCLMPIHNGDMIGFVYGKDKHFDFAIVINGDDKGRIWRCDYVTTNFFKDITKEEELYYAYKLLEFMNDPQNQNDMNQIGIFKRQFYEYNCKKIIYDNKNNKNYGR